MKTNLVIMLVISLIMLVDVAFALPYLDFEGKFHINYTGMCVDAEPSVGFTCKEDNLDLDSLLEIYPTVCEMDSNVYSEFIEMKMEE